MVAIVLLAAVGCTGDADPQPTGTVATTEPSSTEPSPTEPSESPSPTVTVPPLPPEATTQDAAGAQAFVRHWFDTLNYGYATGSTRELAELSSDDCSECADFYGIVESLAADGERALGPAISVDGMTSGPPDGTRAMVILSYSELAVTVVDEEGDRRDFPAGETINAGAIVEWASGVWVMTGIGSA